MSAPIVSEARVRTDDLQQLTPSDLQALADLPVRTLDNVVADFLSDKLGYQDMTVSATSGTIDKVTVAPGHLYDGNGPGYALRDPIDVDLATAMATCPTGQSRYVLILAAGGEADDIQETRTFLDAARKPTNPRDPWPTITKGTKTRTVRAANIFKVVGDPAPQPEVPAIGAAQCLIATVTVTNTAITKISQEGSTQIERLWQVALNAAALQAWRDGAEPALKSLQGTVSQLALALRAFASIPDELAHLRERLNSLEERFNAGSSSVLRGADYFVDESESDPAFAGYSAKISEGLRFPAAATADVAIDPQNHFAANIAVVDNKLLPAYDEEVSALSPAAFLYPWNRGYWPYLGYTTRLYMNQYSPCNFPYWYRGFGVWRVRWGYRFGVLPISQVLLAGDPALLFALQPSYLIYDPVTWGYWRTSSTEFWRRFGFWRDVACRGYWRRPIGNGTLSGLPGLAQAYRPQGSEMVTKIQLPLERGNVPGDVRVLVMADLNGNPDPNHVLGDVTIPDNQIWFAGSEHTNHVVFPHPIFMKGGETYHFVIVSAGSHSLRAFNYFGQAFVGGQLVVPTPALRGAVKSFVGGTWFQLANVVEIGIVVHKAKFTGGSVRIPAQPLQLSGGIDAVDIVAPAIVPEGTSVDYEVEIAGVKTQIDEPSGDHPLLARPSNLPLDIVLTYTDSVAPMIDLTDAKARLTRAGTVFEHVSKTRTPTVNVTHISDQITIDHYDAAAQTITAKLRSGGAFATQTSPTTVTDEVQADGTLRRRFDWVLGSAVTAHKVEIDGVTTDTTKVPVIKERHFSAAP
jgi:hypothetical protein